VGTLSQATSLPGQRSGDAARGWVRWRRQLQAHLYVSPAVALVVVLLYLPFLWTAYLSFTRYDGLTPPVRVGLQNYRDFLHDPVLATSLRNTLLWVVGTVLLPVGLGLVVAVLTYDLRHGTLWRLPFLLPVAFSGVGVVVVWTFILGHGGAANSILHGLHVPGGGTDFLSYAPQNTIAMIVACTWQQLGFNEFTIIWNELLLGLTLTQTASVRPIMASLTTLQSAYAGTTVPVILAAGLLVSLPTVAVFLATQRMFARGLSLGQL